MSAGYFTDGTAAPVEKVTTRSTDLKAEHSNRASVIPSASLM